MYSHTKKYKKHKLSMPYRLALLIIIIVLIIFGAIKVVLAYPSVYATTKLDNLSLTQPAEINWPNYGQSAVGVKGYGVISASPNQKPMPIASVTKIITALAVLDKKPLKPGEQGENLLFSDEDLKMYHDYRQKQGIAVEVNPGDSLTYYKVLQYTLILSANNMADKLAIWAFGSVGNYVTYANEMLKQQGFETLHVDDASGFSPNTVGTASDLIKLGDLAMKNPIITEIVATETIALPNGTQKANTNTFLNYQNNGVVGIKNGLTDEAGGVLLASAKRQVEGQELTIITAVMGSRPFMQSQKDAVALIDPTVKALSGQATIKKGTTIGFYSLPWGGKVDVVTVSDIQFNKWSNVINGTSVNMFAIVEPKNSGDKVGSLQVTSDTGEIISSDVELASSINAPNIKWKLLNPIR
jgi:D-alanyl-D-alanine carboxypeptidase (penicillin-binding protein 5/6)